MTLNVCVQNFEHNLWQIIKSVQELTTYMRMGISRLLQENGIPFSMKLTEASDNVGLRAMKATSQIAKENGISEMSLEEINEEIACARK